MTTPLSKNVQRVAPSATLAISTQAKAMKARGIDVIALSAGEPDFDTPEHIKEAAIQAIRDGMTKYTPAVGTPELRRAIRDKFQQDNGLTYEPAQIVVGCGGKHVLFETMQALLDEEDEVIVPAPYWVSYPEQVKLLGAQPVIIQPASGRLKITAEELQKAITPKTKLFILNSPSNPSGEVYGKEELLALADVILDAGITVLSDEIYEKIRYDGAIHYAIAGIKDGMMARTITVNGVSKAYAMTGWRIGYAAGPKEIMAAVGKIQSQQTSNPCSIAQVATLAALTGPQESTAEMVKAFEERRSVIVERLNRIEGVSCPTPAGAFYVFPNVSVLYGSSYGDRRIAGSVDLCTFLLEEMHVACVPGAAFGMDAHIRLSYATSMENIQKAMDRMEEGIEKLAK
ncbi:MAG: pyridoxal phosphate-dependent aminotransferase [Candidatus Latescibacteria bacterium]|nr:pyridoxal phosphate-dependent aminotransferase [Candidatus Latescibacterota bacterium]